MLKVKSDFLGYSVRPVEAPRHENNAALIDYWMQKREPDGILRRCAFNPGDVPRLLPGIFMAEPFQAPSGGDDFRYRLAGSNVEGRMRRPVMGKTVMEIYGDDFGPRTVELYRRIFESAAPLVLQGHFEGDNLEHIEFEAVHLPLLFDDGTKGILGSQFAFDAPATWQMTMR